VKKKLVQTFLGLEKSTPKHNMNGSAARAGLLKAGVGSECPICLGTVRKPAFVTYCMHQFCFSCIRHWAQISYT
uniref:RING-type E3 ubiquitin transferase n=1 Tax=Zosterops lateralis melanops TaxID=1220523 RepID=A0A8D2P8S8_ZOSLA